MTRKDYNLIAQTLAEAVNDCKYTPVMGVIVAIDCFAVNLHNDNPSYNKLQLVDDIQAMNVNPRAVDALQALRNKYLAELPAVVEF